MSSPSPPPRKPRADSPEDLIDVMPIPFYLCATSSEVNEDPDEASMSSQTFLEMLCYFYGDILSRVLGKRQQSDQKDETTPMPRSVSFLDTQTGISPLPSSSITGSSLSYLVYQHYCPQGYLECSCDRQEGQETEIRRLQGRFISQDQGSSFPSQGCRRGPLICVLIHDYIRRISFTANGCFHASAGSKCSS